MESVKIITISKSSSYWNEIKLYRFCKLWIWIERAIELKWAWIIRRKDRKRYSRWGFRIKWSKTKIIESSREKLKQACQYNKTCKKIGYFSTWTYGNKKIVESPQTKHSIQLHVRWIKRILTTISLKQKIQKNRKEQSKKEAIKWWWLWRRIIRFIIRNWKWWKRRIFSKS